MEERRKKKQRVGVKYREKGHTHKVKEPLMTGEHDYFLEE